jgi:glycerol-3-phosphate dehydrogenase (NAD(P)+)
VNTSKGLEENTLARMSQVLTQELPPAWHRQLLFLSGPNFAAEVGQGLPTATVLACADQRVADWVRDFFMCERFRVYTNPDIVGVELGGAIKNVIAMAVGIADGLALGHNTRAALITRGLAEMTRLGVALGANSHTFAGLAGLGDLVLTCTSNLSRNYRAGVALGEGRQLDEILGETQMVVEGVFTTAAARALAERQRVRMPITEELHRVLFEGKPPRAGVKCLMRRHRTGEVDDLSTLAGLSG